MGAGGQRHTPAALPPGKTRYPLYRRLCGPQDRSGLVRETSPPLGFDPRTVQPVASRCTVWAIPANAPPFYEYFVALEHHVFIQIMTEESHGGAGMLYGGPYWAMRDVNVAWNLSRTYSTHGRQGFVHNSVQSLSVCVIASCRGI